MRPELSLVLVFIGSDWSENSHIETKAICMWCENQTHTPNRIVVWSGFPTPRFDRRRFVLHWKSPPFSSSLSQYFSRCFLGRYTGRMGCGCWLCPSQGAWAAREEQRTRCRAPHQGRYTGRMGSPVTRRSDIQSESNIPGMSSSSFLSGPIYTRQEGCLMPRYLYMIDRVSTVWTPTARRSGL